jgi:tetratricopeptide (TPR) repeat protein
MRYVKPLLWLLLAGVLSSCASAPPKPSTDQAPEPAAPAHDNSAVPALLPPGPITQNPYLTAPAPAVSAAQRAQFKRARQQMHSQNWHAARHTLQALVADAPLLSGPWLNLGIVWQQLKQPGQARAAFERALAANSLNVEAYNQLAALERRAGNFSQANTLYAQALAVWPHSAASHCNQGILYDLYMGRWPEALAHYQACGYLREQQTGQPDTTVQGWIIDLKRRIAAQEANR